MRNPMNEKELPFVYENGLRAVPTMGTVIAFGQNGALITGEKVIREKKSGDKLCTLLGTAFARGDGGFGGPKESAPEPHPIPDRAPDLVHEAGTRPDQAFLYALSGDRNPLHRDPRVARMAGFSRPILHGLCGLCSPPYAITIQQRSWASMCVSRRTFSALKPL
jgi:hypothetical protein